MSNTSPAKQPLGLRQPLATESYRHTRWERYMLGIQLNKRITDFITWVGVGAHADAHAHRPVLPRAQWSLTNGARLGARFHCTLMLLSLVASELRKLESVTSRVLRVRRTWCGRERVSSRLVKN